MSLDFRIVRDAPHWSWLVVYDDPSRPSRFASAEERALWDEVERLRSALTEGPLLTYQQAFLSGRLLEWSDRQRAAAAVLAVRHADSCVSPA